ncbi:MAG: hypothetical protein H0Z33_04700 [Bacillaceae bacterium]|nr:hypothetical protein [Bacillaceae bacterium]
MQTYEEMEYCNVALWFKRDQIQKLMELLVESGMNVAWKDSAYAFTLSVKTSWTTQRLTFQQVSDMYHLKDHHYQIKDVRFAHILQHFIEQARGHAVIKIVRNGQIVVQNIRYGEAVRIVEIKGSEKRILFEKECSVSMEQVMEAFKRTDAERRIPVVRMEIDYELATLHEAILQGNDQKIKECKENLDVLRKEMLLLEA